MNRKTTAILLSAALAALLAGCQAYPTTEAEFGDSVRQMVRSQQVFVAPDETPVQQGDGQRLEGILESYRVPEGDGAAGQTPTIAISTN